MIEKKVIENLVVEQLGDSGYFLVSVDVKPGNVIVVEIDHDDAVSIDECVALNRYIESQLPDREIEDYELEVGSAGISSPFKIIRQYIKHLGKEVEVLLKKGIKLNGVLKEVNEQQITLTIEKQIKPEGAKRKITVTEDLTYSFEEIKYTKYLIRFK